MTRGEVQVFIASLHVISSELAKVEAPIPDRVYAELSAMENFLKKEWEENSRINRISRL